MESREIGIHGDLLGLALASRLVGRILWIGQPEVRLACGLNGLYCHRAYVRYPHPTWIPCSHGSESEIHQKLALSVLLNLQALNIYFPVKRNLIPLAHLGRDHLLPVVLERSCTT